MLMNIGGQQSYGRPDFCIRAGNVFSRFHPVKGLRKLFWNLLMEKNLHMVTLCSTCCCSGCVSYGSV